MPVKVKIHKRVWYEIEQDGLSLGVMFEPVDNSIIIEKLPDGRAVVGYLSDDPNPNSPREDDNFGTMVCWHSRYTLGDKHGFKEPKDFWRALLGDDEYERLDKITDYLLERWKRAHPDLSYASREYLQACDAFTAKMNQMVRERVLAKGYVILPLYLYDHSGITMRTSSFGDPWDSGQVGYIYASADDIKKNWSVKSLDDLVDYKDGKQPLPARERAANLLKREVETYDNYLTGEVYGVCVEVFDKDHHRTSEDACWGYLGTQSAQQEVKDAVAYEVKIRLAPKDKTKEN